MRTSRQDLHPFEYGVGLVSLVVLIAGLNILDAVFTHLILAGTVLLFAGVISWQLHLLANGPLGR